MMAEDPKRLSEASAIGPTDRQSAKLDAARAAMRAATSRRARALAAGAGEQGDDPVWYAVSVRSGFEFAVDKSIVDAGFDRWLPTEEVRLRYRRKGGARVICRVVYPGCLFVRVAWCPDVCHWLKDIDGVISMIGGWVSPKQVAEGDLVEAKAFLGLKPAARKKVAAEHIRAHGGIIVGDVVRLSDGPMAGLSGFVVADADVVSVWVEIMLFGRPARTRVDLANLQKS